jgi:hypothetical protein
MEVKQLYPRISIYSGLLNDTVEMLKTLRETYEWASWYTFGDQAVLQLDRRTFEAFPTAQDWDTLKDSVEQPNPAAEAILNAFYESTKHYVDANEISPVAWNFNSPAVCMYNTNGGASDDTAMHYHTDFQQEKRDEPGYKPYITCTMYLNDDYEGGEIAFKILKEDDSFDEIIYKPKAGDILVFPSDQPYYHSVKLTTKGQKYFVRSFWDYHFPGTAEWHANQKKYGVAEWAEMEYQREKLERQTGRYNLMGGENNA